eukprot:8950287-Alexandrium_andersonii.AAC.1
MRHASSIQFPPGALSGEVALAAACAICQARLRCECGSWLRQQPLQSSSSQCGAMLGAPFRARASGAASVAREGWEY